MESVDEYKNVGLMTLNGYEKKLKGYVNIERLLDRCLKIYKSMINEYYNSK